MKEKELLKEAEKKGWLELSTKVNEISPKLLRKYFDNFNWNYIYTHVHLNEKILKKLDDLLDWNKVSFYQKLSEDFIEENEDLVVWKWILMRQDMPKEFIKRHLDKQKETGIHIEVIDE